MLTRPFTRAARTLIERVDHAHHSRKRHEAFARKVAAARRHDRANDLAGGDDLPPLGAARTLLQRGTSWTLGGPSVLADTIDDARVLDAELIATLERLLRHTELRRAQAFDASVTGIADSFRLGVERGAVARVLAATTLATRDARYLNAALKLSDYFGPSRATGRPEVDRAWALAYEAIERAMSALEAELTRWASDVVTED